MHILWVILLQFLANAAALKLAPHFIDGFSFSGDLLALARTAAIITALHLFVKPIAKLFLGPFIILSLGILSLALNGLLLWLATFWAPELSIATYWDLLLATLFFAAMNLAFILAGKIGKV